jgi:hypothetical protein
LAVSSGVPNLPSGTLSAIIFLRFSPTPEEASKSRAPGVSIEPENGVVKWRDPSCCNPYQYPAIRECRLWNVD